MIVYFTLMQHKNHKEISSERKKKRKLCNVFLTHSLQEPGGPCTKSMEVSESHMEWVNSKTGVT